MQEENINRRNFIKKSALAAGALGISGANSSANVLSPYLGEEGELEVSKVKSSLSKKLAFNKDGKFKIVQFTDIHGVHKKGETDHSYDTMNKILDIEKPDLVMYTGDIVTDSNPKAVWEKITSLSSSRNIPFAVVYGNHDSERDTPRDKVHEIVVGLKGCLNEPKKESVEEVFGYSNQVIPIYQSNNPNQKAFILYLLDSNATHEGIPRAPRKDDWIRANQIEWYVKQSKQLTKENNGVPFPALAFFHIPLHEYTMAATAPNAKIMGWRIEGEGTPALNSGLFSAFQECKDVKGAFVGHDHDNDYVVLHQGIALGYGRFSGGDNTYHTLCRGARVFELTEGKESFDTWVRLEIGRFMFKITVPEWFTSDDSK